jgi:hypothetical protein
MFGVGVASRILLALRSRRQLDGGGRHNVLNLLIPCHRSTCGSLCSSATIRHRLGRRATRIELRRIQPDAIWGTPCWRLDAHHDSKPGLSLFGDAAATILIAAAVLLPVAIIRVVSIVLSSFGAACMFIVARPVQKRTWIDGDTVGLAKRLDFIEGKRIKARGERCRKATCPQQQHTLEFGRSVNAFFSRLEPSPGGVIIPDSHDR